MIKVIHKSNRICAMCRFWNNGRGCPSLKVKSMNGFFEIDNNDSQQCFKTGFNRKPIMTACSDFQCNY